MKTSLRKNSGFTLLEIMLVVLIIGLLIGMGVQMMGNKVDQARVVRARADIVQFKTGLLMYQSGNRTLPTTEQGLKALLVKPDGARNWNQQLESANSLIDPWGKEYQYVQPGVHNPKGYDVFSFGPDMLPNTTDDIGNWPEASGE